jgi:hypothetical protein
VRGGDGADGRDQAREQHGARPGTGYDPELTLPNSAVGKAVLAIEVNSSAARETLGFFARTTPWRIQPLALQELFAWRPRALPAQAGTGRKAASAAPTIHRTPYARRGRRLAGAVRPR